ncbi:MAG: hypothetical protein QF391_04225, partial [Myxococcota bacterium]|nr:hypothetical protein [Myxococcota bacterium]
MDRMEESPLRLGILGADRISPAALLEPARRNPSALVDAVASRDAEKARKLRAAARHRAVLRRL